MVHKVGKICFFWIFTAFMLSTDVELQLTSRCYMRHRIRCVHALDYPVTPSCTRDIATNRSDTRPTTDLTEERMGSRVSPDYIIPFKQSVLFINGDLIELQLPNPCFVIV